MTRAPKVARRGSGSGASRDGLVGEAGEPRFGPEALRAYVLVYCSLALTACPRPAVTTMAGVRALLTKSAFAPGEPGDKEAMDGYSASHDALWLRYNVDLDSKGSEKDTGPDTPDLVFYPGKSVERKLCAFLNQEPLERWLSRALNVDTLPALDRAALTAILGARAPRAVEFRGHVLVGHDRQRLPGVFVIGVRWRPSLVGATQEERLPWLLGPTDFVDALLPSDSTSSLADERPQHPVLHAFRGEPWTVRMMSRALLAWHDHPTPNPWYWRHRRQECRGRLRGVIRGGAEGHIGASQSSTTGPMVGLEAFRFGASGYEACFLPYTADTDQTVRYLRGALGDGWCDGRSGERATIVIVASLSAREMDRVIGRLAAQLPGLERRVRFLVVDSETIAALAHRYSWVWSLEEAAMSEDPARLWEATLICLDTAADLEADGRPAAALACLRSLLSFPRARIRLEDMEWAGNALVRFGPGAPWSLIRDVARLLRPLWRDVRGMPAEAALGQRDAWWVRKWPCAVLASATSDAWAIVPAVHSTEWLGLLRLLRAWRYVGAEDVALDFANNVRAKLREAGASTSAVDLAWDESRPQRPESRSGTHVSSG